MTLKILSRYTTRSIRTNSVLDLDVLFVTSEDDKLCKSTYCTQLFLFAAVCCIEHASFWTPGTEGNGEDALCSAKARNFIKRTRVSCIIVVEPSHLPSQRDFGSRLTSDGRKLLNPPLLPLCTLKKLHEELFSHLLLGATSPWHRPQRFITALFFA